MYAHTRVHIFFLALEDFISEQSAIVQTINHPMNEN